MDFEPLVFLFVSGSVAGFVAGFFGVGGGIVLVPILLYFFTSFLALSDIVTTHLAIGTSLLIVMVTSIVSSTRHHRNGQVIVRAAVAIGAVSVVAAFAGAQFAAVLPGRALQQIFSVVLIVAAARLLMKQVEQGSHGESEGKPGPLILTGAASGVISSLTGVGGGVVSIPMMHGLMKFPMKKAVGTSSAAIVLTSAAAAAGYLFSGLGNPGVANTGLTTIGYLDYIHALPLMAGSLPAAFLGAASAHRVRSLLLTRLFAILMLVVAIRMFVG